MCIELMAELDGILLLFTLLLAMTTNLSIWADEARFDRARVCLVQMVSRLWRNHPCQKWFSRDASACKEGSVVRALI